MKVGRMKTLAYMNNYCVLLNIKANFEKQQYALKLNIIGEGTVLEEIVITGKFNDYNSGTVLKSAAIFEEIKVIVDWSRKITSEDNPVQVMIESAKEISVNFKLIDLDRDGIADLNDF